MPKALRVALPGRAAIARVERTAVDRMLPGAPGRHHASPARSAAAPRELPDLMGVPTREEIKAVRKLLGHHLEKRARPQREPPPDLPWLTWRAAQSADGEQESGEPDEGEDIEAMSRQ